MFKTAEALAQYYYTSDPETLINHLKIEAKKTAELPDRVQAIFTRMNGKNILLISERLDSKWKMYLQACAIACVQLKKEHELFVENMDFQMDIHSFAQSIMMLEHTERAEDESIKNFLLRSGIPLPVANRYANCLM